MSLASKEAIVGSAPSSLEDVLCLVAVEMGRVDRCIREGVRSEVALINQVAEYIIAGGGKRLRPAVHLLAAGACGYAGPHHIPLAAIIEFIHTATLLHDDVVDESQMRRGQETSNAVWGNPASVLVGDFLYSRSFQMMVEVDSMRVMDILAETTNTIAEGEVMQLLNLGNPDTDEARYLDVVRCKTAKLFEAAARLGAVMAAADPKVEQALATYGLHLGNAFQLADDMLDYAGDKTELGKNVGDDLAEGKPTLPLIHVLRVGNQAQRDLVRAAIEQGGLGRLDEVIAAILETDALGYTRSRAEAEAEVARAALVNAPASKYRDALFALVDFAVSRRT